MSFVSIEFLLFLVGTLILYYTVPKKVRWVLLLIISYAFYLFSDYNSVVFILITTITTFLAGLWMNRMAERTTDFIAKNKETMTKEDRVAFKKRANSRKKTILVGVLLFNFAILAALKYFNFFGANMNSLLHSMGSSFTIPRIDILVPLGLSFYTFQSMGYAIDIFRNRYKAEKNIFRFALFVSFFPQIIQGPISRYDDLGVQLRKEHAFDYTKFKFGLQLILWGYFKKLLIADRVAMVVKEVFSGYQAYAGFETLVGILCYALQIYCDFSGGIDISRGVAGVLGIELPVNFERPYFAKNVTEYWRRWHITLSSWMRDYVFYSLMLSKAWNRIGKWAKKHFGAYFGKLLPSCLTSFIVFFLIGVWHGATWGLVAFGLYNATIVVLGMLFQPLFDKLVKVLKINTNCFSYHLWLIIRTFTVLLVSKVLVRAQGLRAAWHMVKTIFTDWQMIRLFDGTLLKLGLNGSNWFVLFLGCLVLLVVSILQERGVHLRETIAKQNLVFRWLLYLIAIAVILVFGVYGPAYDAADFIYQQY